MNQRKHCYCKRTISPTSNQATLATLVEVAIKAVLAEDLRQPIGTLLHEGVLCYNDLVIEHKTMC